MAVVVSCVQFCVHIIRIKTAWCHYVKNKTEKRFSLLDRSGMGLVGKKPFYIMHSSGEALKSKNPQKTKSLLSCYTFDFRYFCFGKTQTSPWCWWKSHTINDFQYIGSIISEFLSLRRLWTRWDLLGNFITSFKSICLSVHLLIYPCVCLSIRSFIHAPTCPSICPSAHS